MKHKLFNFIKKAYDFIDTIGQDKVGIYTAQASFFIILSIFPFLLLLGCADSRCGIRVHYGYPYGT